MGPQELAAKAKTSPGFADLILSQIEDLVYVVDRDYRLVFLNTTEALPAARDVIGERCYETFMSASHPCEGCAFMAVISGCQQRVCHVFKQDDQYYQVTASRLLCEDGTPLSLHVMRDVTADRQRQAWLETEYQLLQSRLKRLESSPTSLAGVEDLLGVSSPWLEVKRLVLELAGFPTVTVLIVGETGTGKELVAQALHRVTFGAAAPFVALNCAAIPEHLLESELFGYERGAFTGASQTKKGLFELAHGGTLFLDEIEELSPAMQPKLLRVLETKSFTRLGGTQEQRVDCRLLCAANEPLPAMVAAGRFRADLYHRLSTFIITIPPLRERRDDIPPLVEAFLAESNRHLSKRVQGIAPAALALLRAYAWPGNVRELKNLIERAVILTASTALIEATAFPPEIVSPAPAADAPPLPLREVERRHLEQALARCQGNKSQAARWLGISRTTLRKKLRDYALL